VRAPIPPWEPLSEAVLADQRGTYDRMRATCPVAESPRGITLFRHADVVAAAADPATFSSAVSPHRMVPNSLDQPEHTAFRAALDPFFTPERMGAFEPCVQRVAHEMVGALPLGSTVDAVTEIGYPLAVRTQVCWLGWQGVEDELIEWMAENHAATRSGDRSRTVAVAAAFDEIVLAQMRRRRQMGSAAPKDPTTELLAVTVNGGLLPDPILSRFSATGRRVTLVLWRQQLVSSSISLRRTSRCKKRFEHIPAIWLPRSTRCCGSTIRSSSAVA